MINKVKTPLMDFEVIPLSVNVNFDGGRFSSEKHCALFNTKTKKIVGQCSNQYMPFQPSQMFDFLVEIGHKFGLEIDTIQVSHDKTKIVCGMNLEEFDPFGSADERISRSLYIYNNLAGDGALQIFLSDLRLRCMNQLVWLLRDAKMKSIFNVKIRHTASLNERVLDASTSITRMLENKHELTHLIQKLHRGSVDMDLMLRNIAEQFYDLGTKQHKKLYEELIISSNHYTNRMSNNRYRALNIATYYADHRMKTRKDNDMNRLIGGPAEFKGKVLNFLMDRMYKE